MIKRVIPIHNKVNNTNNTNVTITRLKTIFFHFLQFLSLHTSLKWCTLTEMLARYQTFTTAFQCRKKQLTTIYETPQALGSSVFQFTCNPCAGLSYTEIGLPLSLF